MFLLKGMWVVCTLNLLWMSSAEVSDSRLQEGVNAFSVDLLKKVHAAKPGNLVISPVSVSALLAILHQGARHSSSRQLGHVLHLTPQESREGYGRLSRSMQEASNGSAELEMASRLFVRRGLELEQDFQDVVSQDFRSAVEQVAFGGSDAPAAINSWVSRATHGRIPAIVEPVLPENIDLMMVNAVYFKSPWLRPFKRTETANHTFTLRSGSGVTVPCMHLEGWLQAGDDPEQGVKWVKLPFLDGNFSMVITVPNENDGLARLLEDLDAEKLSRYTNFQLYRPASVFMPHFRMDSNIDLEDPLQQLGATDIFDIERADLSGVTSSVSLAVSKAFQKANIEVDEDGASAAAATVIEANRKSSPSLNDPLVIRADHPFLATIADGNGLPIFIAIVEDPSPSDHEDSN